MRGETTEPGGGGATPIIVEGLGALAARFDLALVDVWGVLHNGLTAHPLAGEALARFRAGGGFVTLISNAPRPSEAVVGMLDRMGVQRNAYDGVITSGDLTRTLLADDLTLPFHHIGPGRDRSIFEGLGLRETTLADARRVVCTGLVDDDIETAETYRPRLEAMRRGRQTMICANPDLVVERGERLIACAGLLAELYETLGGAVIYAGKPHAGIYEAALDFARASLGRVVARGRVIAIGDALRTDIMGAARQGLHALLVADGIHAKTLIPRKGDVDLAALARLAAEIGATPDAVITRLRW